MVTRPEEWLHRMNGMGQFRMIFHLEASRRAMGLVQAINDRGMKAGVAINPETPAAAVESLLPYIDDVCIMGIAPGFAGQKLLDFTYTKIDQVRALMGAVPSSAAITVDGGVKAANAKQLFDAGADILVVSSGLFEHPQPEESLNEIRRIIEGD
jgi:ribulose-phosphate 3-epimerase